MTNLDEDQILGLADTIYWEVLETLGILGECIEDDPDTGGTRNTEKGVALYYAIEGAIEDFDFN